LKNGREQLFRYLEKLGMEHGYLTIYETGNRSWEEKIYRKEEKFEGKRITIIGL